MLNLASPVKEITPAVKTNKYPIKAIFLIIAIALGLIQGWANRYTLSTEDSISYLDISDAYLRGDWSGAINANWSPLYPWLLSLFIFVLKPSPYWEFSVVKLVNFLIYIFAFGCFDFLLNEIRYYYKEKLLTSNNSKYLTIPSWAFLIGGYTLFLWSSLKWLGISCDTPDMFTAALFYLALGIVLRVHTKSASWLNFIMLGIVLGFGYLSKSVMFPLAFVFLGVALFSVGNIRRALPKVLVALAIFTVIVAPFITAISTAKGRLTIGDSGRLSYAWYINPVVHDHHWQGDQPNSGTPKHPTRKIFDNLSVTAFEFATPIGGTYPVWYDPTYWNEGLQPRFNLIKQIQAIVKNAIFYKNEFLEGLLFAYLILVCVGGRFWLSIKDLMQNWIILIPATAGLIILMCVTNMSVISFELQPSTRYIASFAVALFAGVFTSVRLPNSEESKRLIAGFTLATMLLIVSQLTYYRAQDMGKILSRPEHITWQVAEYINKSGVQPGDKVALLGDKDYLWARLARVKVVSEIPTSTNFWTADDVVKSNVLKAIELTGAKAIVYHLGKNAASFVVPSNGWKKIGKTNYYAYFFDN